MSDKTIDERVVSMKFDNKEFEKNATQSLSTIQRLKQALNFDGAQKNLDNFRKTANSFQLNGISNSIDAIANKFSVMEVAARTAIMNITNSFVNAAKNWASAVTIDPIRTGLGVYEQKINSTMTILSNTGKGLRETNEILDELNEYSDKTIFSLNDMTNALGKFTAAGVDAKKAVTIIKGAANEAATMGAGSAEFSRFIYNLTQAYSMGKMTTIDWKSLENAGVAGRKFKEQLIESAKAMKTLTAEGKTAKGEIVTAANLRDYLKDGIITAEVMTDAFEKYADETTEFGKAANDAATQVKTFTQLMDVLAESVASTWSKSFSYIIGDFYEARRLWTNVSTIFDETVGKMNSKRNTLLAAWKEGFIDPAVEAKMSTQELMNALNSKDFVKNNTLSGRTLLFDSIANSFQAILQVIKPIKEAFREIFPETTARNLWEATKNLRDFTAHLKLSDGALKDIKDAAKGVFMIMSTARNVIKDIIGAIIPATKNVDSLAVIITKIAGALGRLITDKLSKLRTNKSYQEFLTNVTTYTGYAIKIISFFVKKIIELTKSAKESGVIGIVFKDIFAVVSKVLTAIIKGVPIAINLFKLLGVGVAGLFSAIGSAASSFEGFLSKIFSKKDAKEASDNVNKVTKSLGAERHSKMNAGTWTKEDQEAYEAEIQKSKDLEKTSNKNQTLFEKIFSAVSSIVGNVVGIIQKIWPLISAGVSTIVSFADGIMGVLSNISTIAVNITEGIGKAIGNIDTITVLLVGVFTSVTLIANSALGIFINITRSIINVTAGFRSFAEGFEAGAKALKRMNNPIVMALKNITLCILSIGITMWLLTTAFTSLVSVMKGAELKDVLGSIGILILICGLMIAVGKIFSKIKIEKQNVATIFALTLFMRTLSKAFVSIAEVIKGSNIVEILSSLTVLITLGGLMIVLGKQFEKIQVQESSIKTMISLALLFKVMSTAFVNIANVIKGSSISEILFSIGTLISIAGMLMLLGKVFSVIEVQPSSMKTMLSLTLMILALGHVFTSIADTIKGMNLQEILFSIGIFLGIAGMLMLLGKVFSKIEVKPGSMLGAMGITILMNTLAKNFTKIANTIDESDLYSVLGSLGIILILGGVMKRISKAFNEIKVDIITVLGILTFSDFISDIGEFLINCMESIKTATVGDVLLSLVALGELAAILVWIGKVFADISVDDEEWVTLLIVTRFMRVMGEMLVAITESFKDASVGTILFSLGSMVAIAAILVVVGKVFSKLEIGKQSMWTILALSLFMKTLSSVFVTIVEVLKGNTITIIISSLVTLIGMAGLLLLVGKVFSKIKIQTQSVLAMVALSIFMKTLSSVFKTITEAISGNNLTIIISSLTILVGMAGLLMLVGLVFSKIKIQSQSMLSIIAISIFMKTLSSVFSSITEIVKENDFNTLGQALGILIAMAGLLMLVGAAFSVIKVQTSSILTIIAISIFIKTLSGVFKSIVEMIQSSDLNTILGSLGVLIVVAGVLIGVCFAFSKIQVKPSSLVTIVASIISVVTIVAALGLLAVIANRTDMNSVATATDALVKAMLGITAALFILSKVNKGPVSAASVAIVAASMVILAYALSMFTDVNWDGVGQACAMLITISLALALLGSVGAMVIVGAAALLVASASLVVIAYALKQFTGIDWESFGQLAAVLGVLVLVTAILGALNAVAIIGAAALVITAVGLIAIAGAMQLFAQISDKVGGGYLSGIAGGLMLMAVAGVLLSAGASGLILGGVGLTIVAAGLLLISRVDKDVDLARLSGLAGGLMLFALAGIILATSATGLILGGVGLAIIGAGLLVFNAVKIKGKDLISLATGVLMIAGAGVIGNVAGIGLIVLSAGITALAGAMWLLMKVYSSFLEVNLQKMASDATEAGHNVVEGATQGILGGIGTLGKVVVGMASGIITTFAKVLGIASPSEVFKKLGQWILSGLGLGVSDETLNSGLGETMKEVAKNLLGNFTEQLGSGFGDIENIFNKFNKKTKKWVETGGHYEYGRGWVKEGYWEEVEESMFGDFTELFGGLSDSFNTMFSEDGFDGLEGLKSIFEDLDLDEVDIDVDKLAGSFGDLDGAVTNTGDSTKKTTKSFADSMSVFSEFSRKMNTTVRDVQKNLMSQVTGVKEWQTMIENLEHFGYDKEIGLYFLEKGFDTESYNYLQALTAAGGQGIEKVKELNDQFKEFVGLGKGGDKWTEKMTEHYKGLGETTRDLSKLTMTMDMVTGEIMVLSDTVSDINPFSALGEEASESSKKVIDSALALENYVTEADKQAKYLEKKEAAMGKADQNTADAMIESFTEQVQNALGKYFLPSKFTEIGTNICAGLVAGIAMNENYVYDEAERFAKAVVEVMKTNFKEKSPSRITMQMGEYLDEGLAIGLGANGESEKSAKSLSTTLMKELFAAMQQIAAIMNSDEEWQPTIRPIVDFSNIQTSAMEAQRLFDDTQVSLASSDFSNFKASLTPTGTGMMSMTKDEFQQFLTGFANEIVEGINTGDKNVSVNVNLEGDAKGVFKLVKDENDEYRKTSGRSAFA